jgi:hypothetical protein
VSRLACTPHSHTYPSFNLTHTLSHVHSITFLTSTHHCIRFRRTKNVSRTILVKSQLLDKKPTKASTRCIIDYVTVSIMYFDFADLVAFVCLHLHHQHNIPVPEAPQQHTLSTRLRLVHIRDGTPNVEQLPHVNITNYRHNNH